MRIEAATPPKATLHVSAESGASKRNVGKPGELFEQACGVALCALLVYGASSAANWL